METLLSIVYVVASYWAVNKVLYEGKVVIYSSEVMLIMKKFVIGVAFGWIWIPVAIVKSFLEK